MTLQRLIGPRVLVRPLPVPDQTSSGLFIAASGQVRPQMGTVVAVGRHWAHYDHRRKVHMPSSPLEVKVGDLVMYPRMHDLYAVVEGETLLELRHHELLAVIERESE